MHKSVAGFGLDMSVISHNTTTVGNRMFGYDLNRHVQVLSVLGGGCKSSLNIPGTNPPQKKLISLLWAWKTSFLRALF